jgi:hypothetical protein
MRQFVARYWYIFLLAVIGAAGGFLYWKFVGCLSGTCPITAHWYSAMVIGGVFGYLAGSIVNDMLGNSSKNKNVTS